MLGGDDLVTGRVGGIKPEQATQELDSLTLNGLPVNRH
jgi:hypothetical protein